MARARGLRSRFRPVELQAPRRREPWELRRVHHLTAEPIDWTTQTRGRWRAQVAEGRTLSNRDRKDALPFMPGRAGLWLANLSDEPMWMHHSGWRPLDEWTRVEPGAFLVLAGPDLWTAAPVVIGQTGGQLFRAGQWLSAFDEPPTVIEGRATQSLSVVFAARPGREALSIENKSESVLVLHDATVAEPIVVVQAGETWQAQPDEVPERDILISSPLHEGGAFMAQEN